ncbi:MAG: glutathione S-transferase family protein [Hyphomicrobiaceae bacterium]
MKLYIGSKMHSSWSLRPWILMTELGVPFEEHLIVLDTPEFEVYRTMARGLGATGSVPMLVDGDIVVWDTLAIIEYVADTYPDRTIWPQDPAARAHARAIAAEMHAGFGPLRSTCPMNLGRKFAPRALSDAVAANVLRIEQLWASARSKFGAPSGGPYLYGAFSGADAMFAPVVTRFDTYAIPVSAETADYMATILSTPAFVAWREAALDETAIIEADEIDAPAAEILRRDGKAWR